MKKITKLFTVLLAVLLCMGCSSGKSQSSTVYHVGVVQLVDHTSLNTIKNAFDDELKKLGYTDENLVVDFQNGQGDQATLASIAKKFEGEDLDAVVAIATPAAQSVAGLAKKAPVIFSAVTDPVGAGLTSSLEKPDQNITGTSDVIDVESILNLALEIQPNLKTLGLLYNKGEANSVANIDKAKAFAKEKGLKIVESTVASGNEIQSAVDTLNTKVDAIFTPNDNTIAPAMGSVGKSCAEAQVPIYVGADSMVQDGGFASVGINYEDLGRETARMLDEALKGKDVADMPVKVFADDLYIYVNKDVLKKLKITLPESVTSNEKYVEL
ncbi:MAG: ABC transporter substrate binding protein [bacterium]